jgi:Ni,Fe-hydrogenase III small subunit/ferredoxin
MPWVLRGLRDGIVTSGYPRRADGYGIGFRGAVRVLDPEPARTSGLPELCPTGAILVEPAEAPTVRIDRGRCILCGRCVGTRPDLFAFDPLVEVATSSRRALVVPETPEDDDEVLRIRVQLARRVRALRRSVHIRHVDAGSDGAEEAEIAALTGPIYDLERLGMFFTATPRHADVLVVTGTGTTGMADELRRTFEAMPDPKVVIACGTDATSGGLVGPSYSAGGGIWELVPVDVFVPGSPPSPFSLLHGLLLAVGLLPAARRSR